MRQLVYERDRDARRAVHRAEAVGAPVVAGIYVTKFSRAVRPPQRIRSHELQKCEIARHGAISPDSAAAKRFALRTGLKIGQTVLARHLHERMYYDRTAAKCVDNIVGEYLERMGLAVRAELKDCWGPGGRAVVTVPNVLPGVYQLLMAQAQEAGAAVEPTPTKRPRPLATRSDPCFLQASFTDWDSVTNFFSRSTSESAALFLFVEMPGPEGHEPSTVTLALGDQRTPMKVWLSRRTTVHIEFTTVTTVDGVAVAL